MHHQDRLPETVSRTGAHLLALLAPAAAEGDHGVGSDGDPAHPCKLLLLI